MPHTTPTLIDLNTIIRQRAGNKAKYIPNIAVNTLKHLIHQDFINTYLKQGYTGVDFCENGLRYLNITIHVKGLDNIPNTPNQRYTFVSNHPLGAIDGITLGSILGRKFNGQIKYLVNDLLMNLPGLAPLCIPINKLGHQARNLPEQINNAFESQNQIIMFPAGICSRKQNDGTISDITWNKTFVTKSISSHRHIIPIHFIGQNSKRFYTIARITKKLHIKFNLAMLFLPDEMYKSQHKTYTVIIGKPIPYTTLDHTRTPHQWAQHIKQQVYKL